jgi:hypothetical protein
MYSQPNVSTLQSSVFVKVDVICQQVGAMSLTIAIVSGNNFGIFPCNHMFGTYRTHVLPRLIAWENCKIITTNNCYGQRHCLEVWHININHHALNRDNGSYLPQEYLHLVGDHRHPLSI